MIVTIHSPIYCACSKRCDTLKDNFNNVYVLVRACELTPYLAPPIRGHVADRTMTDRNHGNSFPPILYKHIPTVLFLRKKIKWIKRAKIYFNIGQRSKWDRPTFFLTFK